jgi:hypothetical protein
MASDDWTREEVEIIVADYLAMLADELSARPYVKAEHRRRLMPLLRDRSEQSVEFKHANISAILIYLGFPYIRGYKPRANYQALLREVVVDRLARNQPIQELAAVDAVQPVPVPHIADVLSVLTDPPKPSHRAAEAGSFGTSLGVNYLEIEARNQALGFAGEEFVLVYEKARLISAGREALADRIQHVSREVGDSEGFDIRSFEADGSDRLIEVKTTKHGRDTPFFLSRNEVRVSQSRPAHYQLYRLFEFRSNPRMFALEGALSSTCTLDPISFIASAA